MSMISVPVEKGKPMDDLIRRQDVMVEHTVRGEEDG